MVRHYTTYFQLFIKYVDINYCFANFNVEGYGNISY